MSTFQVQCKKCKTDVKIDLDNLNGTCPYCGSKLTVDIDRLGEILKEHEAACPTVKRTGVLSQIVTEVADAQREKRANDRKLMRGLLIFFAAFFLVVLIFAFISEQ